MPAPLTSQPLSLLFQKQHERRGKSWLNYRFLEAVVDWLGCRSVGKNLAGTWVMTSVLQKRME